ARDLADRAGARHRLQYLAKGAGGLDGSLREAAFKRVSGHLSSPRTMVKKSTLVPAAFAARSERAAAASAESGATMRAARSGAASVCIKASTAAARSAWPLSRPWTQACPTSPEASRTEA